MPRTYTKNTDRVRTPLDILTRASEAVAQGGTYTSVAKEFSIDRMKLKLFIRKEKLQGPATSAGYEYLSRFKSVFNDRQESDLAEHIKALCNQYYGLSVVKCRCLAYEFATKNNVNMPDNWARDGKAGVEWMMSFKRRHGLAIRQPEATSLARATAFNRYVVDQFYDNLATVMDKYKFASKDIFNVDESGCHTLQKVVTARGQKQVGSITSGERGELVTLVYTVSATGNTIPPMFIFPRVHYRNHFINAAPPGSVGAANKSGWINVAIFPDYLTHVVQNTRCTKEKPKILIMDNHETHMTDTPVRDRIAAATELRKAVEKRKQHKLTVKAQKLAAKHVTQPNRCLFSRVATSRKRRDELVPVESSDSSSDLDDWQKLVDDDSDQSTDDEIVEGDFVITKVASKKARSPRLLYIARVDVIDDEGYEGLFLRKVQSQLGFGKPSFVVDETDGGSFSKADVVRKLPTPWYLKGSQRKANQFMFNVDLSKCVIKV